MSELTPQLREQIENTIRFLAVDAVEAAGCGHPGAPMGLARPAFEIWNEHLRFDPTDPAWPLRDRFVLSAGHASMLLYSLLHLYGFDLSLDDIRNFRQLDSKTPGHPEYGDTPGVEVTTGPLGQGFGHGVGMALAGRIARARYGVGDVGPGLHHVYGIVSDGDLMEGVSYEASSFAGHLGLGNLVYLYDDNRITIDGPTSLSFSEDVAQRFESQRWHVHKVDGEDHEGISAALTAAREAEDRPSLIITRTTIGYGSPNKADTSGAHGAKLGGDEVRLTKEALGWPQEPTFLVPDEVRAYLAGRIAAKQSERKAADSRLEGWRESHPENAAAWDAARAQRVPEDLPEQLAAGLEDKKAATRSHSHAVLQKLGEVTPFLVGGSADLTGSNNTDVNASGWIGPGADGAFAGANIWYGIREHAMGTVANGIALDGTFRPYVGTFLVFSDYMRPSIRLAALMGVKSVYVFTHDSIFLGEDGPTHQPVEHLDALRAIPGLTVFRPADGVETAGAWAWIAEHADGPAMLALSRQGLPPLDRETGFSVRDIWRGAYCVQRGSDHPDGVLMATGSEVAVACEAAEILTGEGKTIRVVSAPCLELFEAEGEAYQRELLPDGVPVIAIEAARGGSFLRWTGSQDAILGISGFGQSAPASDLAERYGFTAAQVAERVKAALA